MRCRARLEQSCFSRRSLSIAMFALGLSACTSIPHNDVLIFGTNTKFAVDLSTNPTAGGTPELTVGYKRQEAVWMPLIVNGKDVSTQAVKDICGGNAQCLGAGGAKYVGVDGKARDAYSVFASFGAKVDTGGSVGLAQFFATGVAAQRLAANPVAALSLSVQPSETGKAAAEAAAEAAKSAPALEAARALGANDFEQDNVLSERLLACARTNGTKIYSGFTTPIPADQGDFDARLNAASDVASYRKILELFPTFEAHGRGVLTAACP